MKGSARPRGEIDLDEIMALVEVQNEKRAPLVKGRKGRISERIGLERMREGIPRICSTVKERGEELKKDEGKY